MTDARFEDGDDAPLRLIARDAEDLNVISTLVQDSVLTGADLRYIKARRRFTLLLNRFRWEDESRAKASGRRVERVRSLLDLSDVTAVAHQGLTRDSDTVLSLLSVDYTPDAPVEAGEPAGPGRVVLTFAGDGALQLTVECLEVELSDVTRPYAAPSGHVPHHPD
ncbi:DUF2948 family protein [Pararhodobacter marinus]|uniref:DUF2948 family protein n=1 Tax=Pararhodobacter marinus TaxID=2184063 RepID=UPI0035163A20